MNVCSRDRGEMCMCREGGIGRGENGSLEEVGN